jgi:hypothetical protein
MAQNTACGVRKLMMSVFSKIGRLFQIKTRFEAWLVIYAIALGAVERGQHYLAMYPGFGGWLLAVACTGVVFVAGAKLLDSVRPVQPALVTGPHRAQVQRRQFGHRGRPAGVLNRRASSSRRSDRSY